MTAQNLTLDLTSRGVRLWCESGGLKIDAPRGVITKEIKAALVECKTELIQLLSEPSPSDPAPGHCPHCGDELILQDKKRDAWYCGECRAWFNGEGQTYSTPSQIAQSKSREVAEALQLIRDLKAAGCIFLLDDSELRMKPPPRLPQALWARFENAGAEFRRLAPAEAEANNG